MVSRCGAAGTSSVVLDLSYPIKPTQFPPCLSYTDGPYRGVFVDPLVSTIKVTRCTSPTRRSASLQRQPSRFAFHNRNATGTAPPKPPFLVPVNELIVDKVQSIPRMPVFGFVSVLGGVRDVGRTEPAPLPVVGHRRRIG